MEILPFIVNFPISMFINSYIFEKVNEFKYLGKISDKNKLKAEIDNRIKMANKCQFELTRELKSNPIHRKNKLKI